MSKHLKLLIAFLLGALVVLSFTSFDYSESWQRFSELYRGYSWQFVFSTPGIVVLLVLSVFVLSRFKTEGSNGSVLINRLRRLHTSTRDSFVGGLCGGLAEVFPVPAWVWRLGFCFAFAYYSVPALVLYFVLCWLVPEGEEARVTQTVASEPTNCGDFIAFLRRLKRSTTDLWAGGVCGGLGQITPLPSWLWRLGFLVALFYFGTGLLAYIALWMVLPEAEEEKNTAAT